MERTISSQCVYEGRVVDLRLDTVELPGGRISQREIVEHAGSVAIVALDADQNVLLVRQYRTPAERVLLEVPAGGIDPGEQPEECALRELQEETGFAASRIERLGGFYSAPGFCTEYLHLYMATGLTPNPKAADDDESIELVRVPLAATAAMIAAEEIRDAKSVAGLLLVLLKNGPSS